MYDVSSEPREFIAAGRDEAVAKACDHFRLSAEALAIHEFDSGEVYGLASRVAIVAVPLERRARDAGRTAPGRSEERSGGGEREREAGPRSERGDRGERGGRGDGRGRGDRDRGGRAESRGGRGGRDRGGRGEGREPREAREVRETPEVAVAPPRAALAAEPSVGTAIGALGEIGRFVLGAVERMGFGAFEIAESVEEGLIVLALRGAAARELGQGDGRSVDALQLLANQAAMRLSEEPDRIVLDVEGNAEEREVRLAELADRAAQRARETGRSIALDPMSPRDRRVIHLALRDAQGIATMSMGESRYRQVVVVPEGAPEYEEAVLESRAAAAAAEGE